MGQVHGDVMANDPLIDPWRYATAGLELGAAVGLFALGGYGLDHWLGTSPWGLLGGAITGIVGGLYKLVRDATRANRRMRPNGSSQKDSARDPGPTHRT